MSTGSVYGCLSKRFAPRGERLSTLRHRTALSAAVSGFVDNDLKGDRPFGGFVEDRAPRLGNVEDSGIGDGEQGGEPPVLTQLLESPAVAAEHQSVHFGQ